MPSDFAAGIEAAARVVFEAAEGSRVLHHASEKDADRDGINIHGEAWRVATSLAAAIRALTPTASEATAIGAGEACADCGGTGANPTPIKWPGRDCPTCNGSGKAASPKVASDTAPCEREAAVERMIRVIPAYADRKWDNNPIQETEREWMRPLYDAAFAASPKPDKATPVDPGVEGVREALFNSFRAVWFNGRGTVGSYDSEAVEAFWKHHVELVLAAKPIAGMDADAAPDAS